MQRTRPRKKTSTHYRILGHLGDNEGNPHVVGYAFDAGSIGQKFYDAYAHAHHNFESVDVVQEGGYVYVLSVRALANQQEIEFTSFAQSSQQMGSRSRSRNSDSDSNRSRRRRGDVEEHEVRVKYGTNELTFEAYLGRGLERKVTRALEDEGVDLEDYRRLEVEVQEGPEQGEYVLKRTRWEVQ